MTYAPTTHAGRHHVSGDRILLIVLALLGAAAVAALATGTWTLPTIGGDTESPVEASTVSAQTRAHAAEAAAAVQQLDVLRGIARVYPSTAAAIQEDITTLELAVTGQLPLEAVQTAPSITQGPDVVSLTEVRDELAALRELVRVEPVVESVYHDRILLLEAISDGYVPAAAAQQLVTASE